MEMSLKKNCKEKISTILGRAIGGGMALLSVYWLRDKIFSIVHILLEKIAVEEKESIFNADTYVHDILIAIVLPIAAYLISYLIYLIASAKFAFNNSSIASHTLKVKALVLIAILIVPIGFGGYYLLSGILRVYNYQSNFHILALQWLWTLFAVCGGAGLLTGLIIAWGIAVNVDSMSDSDDATQE